VIFLVLSACGSLGIPQACLEEDWSPGVFPNDQCERGLLREFRIDKDDWEGQWGSGVVATMYAIAASDRRTVRSLEVTANRPAVLLNLFDDHGESVNEALYSLAAKNIRSIEPRDGLSYNNGTMYWQGPHLFPAVIAVPWQPAHAIGHGLYGEDNDTEGWESAYGLQTFVADLMFDVSDEAGWLLAAQDGLAAEYLQ